MNEAAVSRLFRALYLSDVEAGLDRPLSDYQELFPGFETSIEEQFERISLTPADGHESLTQPAVEQKVSFSEGGHFGHYRILRELGRGGQAIVYLAEDENLSRQVALKVLTRLHGPSSEGTLHRFQREAEVCSKLEHPGICTVFEAGHVQEIPFIAMQFVDGDSLARQIAKSQMTAPEDAEVFFDEEGAGAPAAEDDGSLPDRERVRAMLDVFARVADALDAAHEADIIHRDIKPGNIMVGRDGRPVVLDFGLAQDEDEAHLTLTQTGDFFGTPAYMSPEQISAHRIRLDRRTDVFSLGVTIYECLTFKRPFDAGTREGVYQAILTKEAVDARKLNPAISRDLWTVIQKSVAKDRDQRYGSAAELASELRAVRNYEPIKARPAGPLLRLYRWSQRNRAIAALLVLVVVALVGGFAIAEYRSRQSERERAAEQERERIVAMERFRADVVGRLQALRETTDDPLGILASGQALAAIARDLDKLPDGIDIIREQLIDRDADDERIVAVNLLGYLDGEVTIPIIKQLALHDPEHGVRAWASRALMFFPADLAEPALREVLEMTDDETCRVNSLFGLCRLGDKNAMKMAIQFYRDEKKPPMLRSAIAMSMPLIRQREAYPIVRELENELAPQMQHWAFIVGFYKWMKTPESIERLRVIAANEEIDQMVREAAEDAVKELSEQVEE